MTFFSWANNLKWWQWANPMASAFVAALAISEGAYWIAAAALSTGTIILTATFLIDMWTWRARTMLAFADKQSDILDEALKALPPEKATELRAKHKKLISELLV